MLIQCLPLFCLDSVDTFGVALKMHLVMEWNLGNANRTSIHGIGIPWIEVSADEMSGERSMIIEFAKAVRESWIVWEQSKGNGNAEKAAFHLLGLPKGQLPKLPASLHRIKLHLRRRGWRACLQYGRT